MNTCHLVLGLLAVGLFSATSCFASIIEIFPPPPADECVGPGFEAGLSPIVQHLAEMIPFYEFLEIFLEALSNDDDVVRALAYLQGPQFGRIVYDVGNLPGWRHVIGYYCDELGFHMDYFLGMFGYLFDVQPQPPASLSRKRLQINRRRPGLIGLIEDIAEIMPTAEMAAYLRAEYERNEYVRRAAAKIRGPEFQSVAEAILRMPEFAGLKVHLAEFGVDVECLICGMQAQLGWLEAEECRCDGN